MKKIPILLIPWVIFASVRITIIVDNFTYNPGLKTAWGFSSLVESGNLTLLFDTGPSPEILKQNMKKIGISPKKIKYIFLSHRHLDHIVGLKAVLQRGQKIFILKYFPASIFKQIKESGAIPVVIEKQKEIFPGIYSSGPMGSLIKEQSLFIKTRNGIVIITGCAHPGILKIAKKAKTLGNIWLLLGGFHLAWTPAKKIREIALKLKNMGIKFIAPSHCSGETSRQIFFQFFKNNLIKPGVGYVFNI